MMEDNKPASPIATIRPHHALCALFFEGKGYSKAFVENMTTFLADPNQQLQVSPECDTICQACPHNQNGYCDEETKVSLFDQRTLSLTKGLQEGPKPIPLNELCQNVFENILQQGLLAEVCGECEWAKLCQGKWQRKEHNPLLLPSKPADSQPS